MNEKVQQVNKLLLAGEPGNITTDDHAKYASTGYKPQAIVDAMNEIFWNAWGFEELNSELIMSKDGVPTLAVCQVSVRLKDVEFQPVGWGQARIVSGDIGDAKKGAQTDAIKKALSYFSLGSRAYHGLLKEGKGAAKAGAHSSNGHTMPTYRDIYEKGKAKGLWQNASGFFAFSSAEIGQNVTQENVKSLSAELLLQLDKAVEQEQAA
jgi:hypothetical protein